MNLIQSAHPVKTNPIFSRNIGLVSRSDSLLIKTVKATQFCLVRVASTIKISHFHNKKLVRIFPRILPNYFFNIQIEIYPVVQISHFWQIPDKLVIFVMYYLLHKTDIKTHITILYESHCQI